MSREPSLIETNGTGRPPRAGVLALVLIADLTLVVFAIPEAAEALQWERGRSFPGSLLTSLTGHLTHWSRDHLIWDLATFIGLSILCLRLIPHRYGRCLGIAALAIPLEIALNQPSFQSYRGLSGIDSALFGLLLAALWRRGSRTDGDQSAKLLAVIGATGFLGKSLLELINGQTLVVDATAAGFTPAVSAHLVGLASGLIAGTNERNHHRRLVSERPAF